VQQADETRENPFGGPRPTSRLLQDTVVLALDRSERELSRLLRSNGIRGGRAACAEFLRLLAAPSTPPRRTSVVLLSDELLRLCGPAGAPLSSTFAEAGVVVGVRGDGGTRRCGDDAGFVTVEPEHLRWKLAEYAALGARFAWWRSVMIIGRSRADPSLVAANAARAVRFARSCWDVGLLPVIAVDVRRDGSHDVWACADATSTALGGLAAAIDEAGLDCHDLVVAAGMVVEGAGCRVSAEPAMVATATAGAFSVLPCELGAVLLGLDGQRPGRLARNVEALRAGSVPWPTGYVGGRVLVDPVLAAWQGCAVTAPEAARALVNRVDAILRPRR
jgi:fructose-bisphosphate aldolase class I